MGGIGTAGSGRARNDEYVKYTVATDTYTTVANDDAIFAHAYDRDKLWYINDTNEQMGYIDISDDSENDDQVAANPARTAGFSDHFGVEDSLAGVFSKVATAGLMSIDFQGREGTAWTEGGEWHYFSELNVEEVLINESLLDAKGDLISASADNTPAILSVGVNGEFLVPNSSTSTGLEWVGIVTYEGVVVVNEGQVVYT